mgnify:CR=1 FL=1
MVPIIPAIVPTINQSILFKEGSKLRTISLMKNILAEATISEEFMRDFGRSKKRIK